MKIQWKQISFNTFIIILKANTLQINTKSTYLKIELSRATSYVAATFHGPMSPQVSGTGGRRSGETHIRDAWRPPPNLGIFGGVGGGGDVRTSLKL